MIALYALTLAAVVGDSKPPSLAVIAPRELVRALNAFAEHRRESLPTSVFVLEEILLTETGVDAPEKIKRCLFRAWRDQNLRYALLIGDAATMPVRWMMLDRVHAPAHDVAFYPSDLYYADLARADGSFDDWNSSKDGVHARYFGEVHGEHHKQAPMNFDAIDYVPEIAVGRWLVRTANGAYRCAEATLLVEQAPPPALAAFAVVEGWVDARPNYESVAKAIGAPFAATTLYYGGDRPPTNANLLALVEGRASFVAHAGHGSSNGWEGALEIAHLAAPPSDRVPHGDPAVIACPIGREPTRTPRVQLLASAGCSTATFVTEPPYGTYVDVDGQKHAGTNAGQVFTVDPPPPAPIQPEELCVAGFGAAVLERGASAAYFGCTTGSQPCALTLVEELALAWPTSKRAGDAWIASITRYVEREKLRELVPTESWYPASIFFQGMKFIFLGDPSMPVVWRAAEKPR